MGVKRILVTGSSGFIGQPLVRSLARAGYAVRAVTRRPMSFPHAVDIAIVPDFLRPIDWAPILRGMDVVIHLAGMVHADQAYDEYQLFDKINRQATQGLARATAEAGIERFLYISSVRAQTGPSAVDKVREQDEARPTDHYGRSKLAAESIVRAAGVPFTILRPVVIYGPHPKGNMRALVRLASSPWPLPLGGFSNKRSILGIENFISVILFLLNSSATEGETYLVADPRPIMFGELLAMLRKAQGSRPRLVYVPPGFFQIALMLVNRRHLWERIGNELVVDTTKLESLGWRPALETYDGLRAMLCAENGEGLAGGEKIRT
jgi:nucleoside-diphosphate-sugar epimerase